jgi:hypothetical protein
VVIPLARTHSSTEQTIDLREGVGTGALLIRGVLVVSPNETGLIFVGPPGAGCSTTALVAAELAGWCYAADELVVVPAPFTHATGVFRMPTADATTLHSYGLAVEVVGKRRGKDLIAAEPCARAPARVTAVILPTFSPRRSRWTKIPRGDAVVRIAACVSAIGISVPPIEEWLRGLDVFELAYSDARSTRPVIAEMMRRLRSS